MSPNEGKSKGVRVRRVSPGSSRFIGSRPTDSLGPPRHVVLRVYSLGGSCRRLHGESRPMREGMSRMSRWQRPLIAPEVSAAAAQSEGRHQHWMRSPGQVRHATKLSV